MVRFSLSSLTISVLLCSAPPAFGFSPVSSVKPISTTNTKMSASLKPYIETLIKGERSLTSEETEAAFSEILQGADEVQVGSFENDAKQCNRLRPQFWLVIALGKSLRVKADKCLTYQPRNSGLGCAKQQAETKGKLRLT